MRCPACESELDEKGQCLSCNDIAARAASEPPTARPETEHIAGVELEDYYAEEPLFEDSVTTGEDREPEEPEEKVTEAAEAIDDAHTSPEESPEELPEEPAEEAAAELTSSGSISTGSVTGSVINSGDIDKLIFFTLSAAEERKKEEGHLNDFTQCLPARGADLPGFVPEQLTEFVDKLKEERIILISCPDEDLALSTIYSLLDHLDIADDQRRMLNFEARVEDSVDITIETLLSKKKDSDKPLAIVADARSEKSQMFLDSVHRLSRIRLYADATKERMRSAGLWLLCNVDTSYLDRRKDEKLPSAIWRIPFLKPLLNRYDAERSDEWTARILKQRESGMWSRDEREFYFEIKDAIEDHRLLDQIEQRSSLVKVVLPDSLAKVVLPDSAAEDNSFVAKAALYVACYFPGLTHWEFDEVVALLLKNTSTAPAISIKGQMGQPFMPGDARQPGLAQTWQAHADSVRRECLLETVSIKESERVISFSDHRLREVLKECLEKENGFYLEKQLWIIQSQGLLFHPSTRIAGSFIQMIAERAASHHTEYDLNWLIGAIAKLKEHCDPDNKTTAAQRLPVLQFLRRVKGNRLFWAYRRMALLLRKMLEFAHLNDIICEFFDRLIYAKHYDCLLYLVKQLRYAPGLDEFYWMRQLLERGNKETRTHTYRYLRSYLTKMGPNIYDALQVMEPWLPSDGASLSTSNRLSLTLWKDYCTQTVARFDPQHIGLWPSWYPLFALLNEETVDEHLGRVIKWLFHPCLETVSPGSSVVFQSNVLSAWAYILCGPQASCADPAFITHDLFERADADTAGESGARSPAGVLDRLLKLVASTVGIRQQKELIRLWRDKNRKLLNRAGALPFLSRERNKIILERHLIKQLIKRLIDLQKIGNPMAGN